MTALMGTFVKLATMADGTPRITIEMQCSLAEVAAMGLVPGVPFALARLSKEAANNPRPAEQEKPKGGALAKLAAMWCQEPTFWKWACVSGEAEARLHICEVCRVDSRAELDNDDMAAMRFQEMIRLPYMSYMQGRAA